MKFPTFREIFHDWGPRPSHSSSMSPPTTHPQCCPSILNAPPPHSSPMLPAPPLILNVPLTHPQCCLPYHSSMLPPHPQCCLPHPQHPSHSSPMLPPPTHSQYCLPCHSSMLPPPPTYPQCCPLLPLIPNIAPWPLILNVAPPLPPILKGLLPSTPDWRVLPPPPPPIEIAGNQVYGAQKYKYCVAWTPRRTKYTWECFAML